MSQIRMSLTCIKRNPWQQRKIVSVTLWCLCWAKKKQQRKHFFFWHRVCAKQKTTMKSKWLRADKHKPQSHMARVTETQKMHDMIKCTLCLFVPFKLHTFRIPLLDIRRYLREVIVWHWSGTCTKKKKEKRPSSWYTRTSTTTSATSNVIHSKQKRDIESKR